ncbi:MAG: cob(I)yrinic acid a,c-diamide adenosyltransferase [Candidatus Sungbacteria bacterium RIFCSPLOWO2_12_FULL_41_11]|uniref:Cob(I)yrinic acid a,c-diamide adenosyltransferase n=1 Tax=Candidatus Sungbacteria bacterium RIFCSPLOWO2_12_FULL_41_11 TaxID=1802286 RepID=A0A1G2LTP7_9BACT|nr:MAG: Cob(I)alamin adenosyltransferase [Parcubacteria group bacterium GW2011_GWA2_42_14]OHA14884.1 MAG: cob(I)yrinic acid a,c-diamide adenosyltransferase [Candidatus Sungbacteria bacterium RIFCSPLOWO2_12_FULL_41_11]
MILIFTGNGKGKTTAALGQALRSVGEGKRVLMIQFIKGPWKSGEDFYLEKFNIPRFTFNIFKTGLGFVGILDDKLPIKEHKKAAEEGLWFAKKEIESGKWDMVILDEINNAVSLGLIPKEKVLELIKLANQPTVKLEYLILTGRDAPQEFIGAADIVTEMKDIKHVFEKGVKAKRGIEY